MGSGVGARMLGYGRLIIAMVAATVAYESQPAAGVPRVVLLEAALVALVAVRLIVSER